MTCRLQLLQQPWALISASSTQQVSPTLLELQLAVLWLENCSPAESQNNLGHISWVPLLSRITVMYCLLSNAWEWLLTFFCPVLWLFMARRPIWSQGLHHSWTPSLPDILLFLSVILPSPPLHPLKPFLCLLVQRRDEVVMKVEKQ